MATWLELSRDLKTGDRITFVSDWDRYPDVFVKAGETAVVVENSLNEIEPTLFVRPDNEQLQQALKEWDGLVHVYGPWYEDETWNDKAPIRQV
jgi:hypothetical protein